MLNAEYVERGASEENKEQTVQRIISRQKEVEKSNGELHPLLIFPSGSTFNGSHILKFKRGSFIGEKRVRPMMIKNDLDATISIAYDVADVLSITFLQMSWMGFQVIEMGLLPDFEPNEYLFQTH